MISSKKKSARQESRIAQRYDGHVTPGSGNGWVKKNDVRADGLSIEAKYTDKKQFTLKQADLHTAETHALMDGRDSVFIISFSGEEWAVIREADYYLMRDAVAYQQVPVITTLPDPADEGWLQPMLPGADAWS